MRRQLSVFNRRAFAAAAGSSAAAFSNGIPAIALQATPTDAGDARWAEFTEHAESIAPSVVYLASEIVDDTIQPISGLNQERAQAVGSSFKLYVLAEIGRQVSAGQLDWGQPVAIREEWLSVPAGDLRYVTPALEFTLRYVAERMIQKSDNTATDHAIHTVGRENVEAMFATAGHADPERNVPLLTTREFAMMKFLYPDIDGYLAADVAERREILENEIDPLSYEELLETADEQVAPLHVDTVEWFCSPTDLTNVMVTLKTMAESDFALQPLFEVLTLETQVPLDGEIWPYAGFKGGSEIGLLQGTWLLRRHDNRWFVLSIGFVDTEHALDMEAVLGTLTSGFDLLAEVP